MFEILSVHDTIQGRHCVVHYFNMKINGKLVEEINAQF